MQKVKLLNGWAIDVESFFIFFIGKAYKKIKNLKQKAPTNDS